MKFFPHTRSATLSAIALALALAFAPATGIAPCRATRTPPIPVAIPAPAPGTTDSITAPAPAADASATAAVTGTVPPPTAAELIALINNRVFTPAPGFGREASHVATLLEQYHYNRNAVKPADYASVIQDFMTRWDGQRHFFLQTDKDDFAKRYTARWIYNNLTSLGKTDPGYEMFAVYQKRFVDRVTWILDRLEKPIDLDSNDTYHNDRKDAPWPADPAAADALWEQLLKFELTSELLNKKTLDEKTLDEARAAIRKRYERWLKNLSDVESKDVSETYLTTIARLYDPHSDYWSAETNEEFNVQMRLQVIGIGASLSVEDNYCTIQEIVVGGPADLDKQLQPKDKIIAVAQDDGEPVDIIGMKLNKAISLIRGKKGTTVHLTVIPADDPTKRKKITLVRDIINIDSQRAKGAIHQVPAPGGSGTIPVGVITLLSFYDAGKNDKGEPVNSCSQDVATLIEKFKAAPGGIQGLVLDLRFNGGGFLPEAVNLAGLFIKPGPVVQVKNFSGQVQVDKCAAPEPKYTGPLAVLVNHYSASATEIVAGALQQYGRAIIIGSSATHGKGTVQQVVEMKNLAPALARLNPKTGTVKFTIQKFYLPDGYSTQMKGVVPDIILPNWDDVLPHGEKSQPKALAWDEISPSKYNGRPLSPDLITALRSASEQRQATLEEFTHHRKIIDRFKTQYDNKTVSLNLNERRAQKDADKATIKEEHLERNRLAKEVGYESQEFLIVPDKPKNRTAASDKKKKPRAPQPTGEPPPAGDTGNTNDNTTDKPGATNDSTRQPVNDNQNEKPTDTPAPPSDSGGGDADGYDDEEAEDDDSGLSLEQRQADAKKLDIPLREALRVLLDKINLERAAK